MRKESANYFEDYYLEFLREFHPDLVKEMGEAITEEVKAKGEEAFLLYEEKRKEGGDVITALDEAHEYLKRGKLFSKYSLVKRLTKEKFPVELKGWKAKGKEEDLYLALVDVCESIFKENRTDDEYFYEDKLEKEIVERIGEYL